MPPAGARPAVTRNTLSSLLKYGTADASKLQWRRCIAAENGAPSVGVWRLTRVLRGTGALSTVTVKAVMMMAVAMATAVAARRARRADGGLPPQPGGCPRGIIIDEMLWPGRAGGGRRVRRGGGAGGGRAGAFKTPRKLPKKVAGVRRSISAPRDAHPQPRSAHSQRKWMHTMAHTASPGTGRPWGGEEGPRLGQQKTVGEL